MCQNVSKAEIVRRWWEKLFALRSTSSSFPAAGIHSRLYAKVLRYLIERYQDPGCWNRFAEEPQSSQERPIAVANLTARQSSFPNLQPRLPKPAGEMRPRLAFIHSANVDSYHDFGM